MKTCRIVGYTAGASLLLIGALLGEIFAHDTADMIGRWLLVGGGLVAITTLTYHLLRRPRPRIRWTNRSVQIFCGGLFLAALGLYLTSQSHEGLGHNSYQVGTLGIALLAMTFVFFGDAARCLRPKKQKKSS